MLHTLYRSLRAIFRKAPTVYSQLSERFREPPPESCDSEGRTASQRAAFVAAFKHLEATQLYPRPRDEDNGKYRVSMIITEPGVTPYYYGGKHVFLLALARRFQNLRNDDLHRLVNEFHRTLRRNECEFIACFRAGKSFATVERDACHASMLKFGGAGV